MADTSLQKITVVDTSIASTNVGDEIIMDAVNTEIAALFPAARHYRVASHEKMAGKSRRLIQDSSVAILGGTNMLSSHAAMRSVWKLSPLDLSLKSKFVTMGCGWYHDEGSTDPITKLFYKRLLSPTHLHAVRDDFTRDRLRTAGIKNVINTGCPTLWQVPKDLKKRLPKTRASQVVTTVNTYMPDREADQKLLELLARNYDTVHAWVQTSEDHAYLKSLMPDVRIVAPNLAAYDALLAGPAPIDYVGNRLHGGIRALQHGRRAIIVEIDNRAREMGADFNLPTVKRREFDHMQSMIEDGFDIDIRLPDEAIARWRRQWSPAKTC